MKDPKVSVPRWLLQSSIPICLAITSAAVSAIVVVTTLRADVRALQRDQQEIKALVTELIRETAAARNGR